MLLGFRKSFWQVDVILHEWLEKKSNVLYMENKMLYNGSIRLTIKKGNKKKHNKEKVLKKLEA